MLENVILLLIGFYSLQRFSDVELLLIPTLVKISSKF